MMNSKKVYSCDRYMNQILQRNVIYTISTFHGDGRVNERARRYAKIKLSNKFSNLRSPIRYALHLLSTCTTYCIVHLSELSRINLKSLRWNNVKLLNYGIMLNCSISFQQFSNFNFVVTKGALRLCCPYYYSYNCIQFFLSVK